MALGESPRIESAAGIIDDAVVTLRRNADEQDRASSVEAGAILPGIDGALEQVPQPLPALNARGKRSNHGGTDSLPKSRPSGSMSGPG